MPPKSLPPDLERQLQGELDTGETLLWSGQPLPSRMARQGTCLVLFGIPWTLFALFWTSMAGWMTGGMSWLAGRTAAPVGGVFALFPLFGLPFVLVGFGLLTSPVWLARKAARTAYAVTSRRVLILDARLFGGTITRSVPPSALSERTRTQFADGYGDLIFPRLTRVSYDAEGHRHTQTTGFYGIPDVKAVDDLIRHTFGEQ